MSRRFFRHGELPLVLLAVLAERELNAYELMADLGELLAPHYRPSPGSIYPAVDALEAEGLIERTDGARTTYAATPAGRAGLEQRREALAAFELRTGARVSQRLTVETALARFAAEAKRVAGELDAPRVQRVLERALSEIQQQAETRSSRVKEA